MKTEIKVHCTFDRMVDASELKQDVDNPNRHPESQLAIYEKILRGTGWRRAVVVSNRSGCITKGHGATLAALRIGCAVPVDFQDYPDRKSEIADMLADNKLAEKSERSEDKIQELIASLGGEMLDMTGFSKEELLDFAPAESGKENEGLGNDVTDKVPKERQAYIVPIALTHREFAAWEKKKETLGVKSCKAAFMKLAGL